MIQESEVREKLSAVLSSVLDLENFGEWLARSSWNMHLDSEPNAQELVSSIQMVMDEYDAGALSREELFDEFAALLDQLVLSVSITVTGAHVIRPAVSAATAYLVPERRALAIGVA